MYRKFKIRRRTLVVTLMLFATLMFGLQTLLFSWDSGCTCDSSTLIDDIAPIATCCGTSAEALYQASCCSDGQVTTASKPCSCNPEALICECGDCGCSTDNTSPISSPAVPVNESTKVVTPTLICSAPFVGFPRDADINRAGFPKLVAQHAALSAQETCVLLSRFTC